MADNHGNDEFLAQADPYRRELLAHCYRMLGSVHDAEDLVQETYLRAWRSYDKFAGRSSLRTWLYRIATNACLTALDSNSRRPLPTGLGAPADDPTAPLAENHEVPWLEPVPDSMLGGDRSDPAAIVADQETIRLAFIVALQNLPPRQRAVLVLREVLKWKASEVAELLDMTTAGVNSAMQRARAQLDAASPTQDEVVEPTDAEQRELLDKWVAAFQAYDTNAIVELFTKEAVWEMPPFLTWVRGAEKIGELIATHCPAAGPGDQRLIATVANGQPAFGLYMKGEDGVHRAFQLQVLTIAGNAVSHAVAFFDTTLFGIFGLPETLAPEAQLVDG